MPDTQNGVMIFQTTQINNKDIGIKKVVFAFIQHYWLQFKEQADIKKKMNRLRFFVQSSG